MEFNKTILIERDDGDAKLLEPGRWATFHCRECNTVLGDSLSVCGELKCLDSIIFCGVTENVEVSSEMECGNKGKLANCIFSSLMCGECSCTVGKVLHAAPQCLDGARSLFLLHKTLVACYVLDTCSLVKASTLSFEVKPLVESINKVRRQFELHFDDMKSRLADLRNIRSKVDK